jgi:hypothetical protein
MRVGKEVCLFNQRNIAEKNPRNLPKNPRRGADVADAVFPATVLFPAAGGIGVTAGAGTALESDGKDATSFTGAGGGPVARNTKGASTWTCNSADVVPVSAPAGAGVPGTGVWSTGSGAAVAAGLLWVGFATTCVLPSGAMPTAGVVFSARSTG